MIHERLLASERDAAPRSDCPAPEALWDAARGAAAPDAVRAVVLHTAECGVCSAAWRLAAEVARTAGVRSEPATPVAPSRPRRPIVPWLLAAAAVLAALALPLALRDREPDVAAEFRDERPAAATIRAQVPDGAALPREAFELAWEPLAEGATYRVEVFTETLAPVARADDLDEPRWTVPAAALADLPAGTRLVWRVQAFGVRGAPVRSPAFLVAIADGA